MKVDTLKDKDVSIDGELKPLLSYQSPPERRTSTTSQKREEYGPFQNNLDILRNFLFVAAAAALLLIGLMLSNRHAIVGTGIKGDILALENQNGIYPRLVVLDLDATFWNQEMFRMTSMPIRTVTGDLNGRGSGIIGVVCESDSDDYNSDTVEREIRLFDGSLEVFQRHYVDGQYPATKFLFASSADTPFAEQVARSALHLLEIIPGLSVWDAVVMKDWSGNNYNQIGRQASKGLSSNKAKSHFPMIRNVTGVRYDEMLFFDDCIWGDNVGMVQAQCRERGSNMGPAAVRTPHGFTVEKWNEGTDAYRRQYEQIKEDVRSEQSQHK